MKQSHSDLKIAILATIRDFTYCAQVAVLVGIVAAVVVAVADVPDPRAARVGEAVDLVSFGTRAEGWGGELYVDALLLFYFCHRNSSLHAYNLLQMISFHKPHDIHHLKVDSFKMRYLRHSSCADVCKGDVKIRCSRYKACSHGITYL